MLRSRLERQPSVIVRRQNKVVMNKDSRIYIAGHQGQVGSAIHRKLKQYGYKDLLLRPSSELDLRDQSAVRDFFDTEKPEFVFLAACRTGGIHAHEAHRAEFLYDNLLIQSNIIHQSYLSDVRRLIHIASSLVYPMNCPQPVREEYLLTGELENSYSSYSVSKIAGIKMCQAYDQQYHCKFINVIAPEVYGEYVGQKLSEAPVLPALIQKVFDARIHGNDSVEVWGSGTSRKEFIHREDLADACIFLMNSHDTPGIINVGTGESIAIRELAELVRRHLGYRGHLNYNPAKPDVWRPQILDTSAINRLGWYPKIKLQDGLKEICDVYEQHHSTSLSSI